MDIVFLTLEEVIEAHRDQIQRYGGAEGIRDLGLLQSAVAMPQASFGGEFLHKDIFEMAGAYLFHIVQNHPCVDGNKRTGTVAAIVFLTLNNADLEADNDTLEALVLSVARGEANKVAIAEFLRTHAS